MNLGTLSLPNLFYYALIGGIRSKCNVANEEMIVESISVGNYDEEKRERHNEEVFVLLITNREKGLNKEICVEGNHP